MTRSPYSLSLNAGPYWAQAAQVDILAACAILLSLIALALLWRCHLLHKALRDAQSRLTEQDSLLQQERCRIAADHSDRLRRGGQSS
ncbi:MAG: hypothetical protein V4724_01745 [Pseudomonadota bacterium]